LGVGVTIQPCKKVIVTKPQRGGQGPNWAVEPYDDDDNKLMFGNYIQDRYVVSCYIKSKK
jgi:hypothetical protein